MPGVVTQRVRASQPKPLTHDPIPKKVRPWPGDDNDPRLLVVYDREGWVFHRIALRIAGLLDGHGYRVQIASTADAGRDHDCDALFLLWWNAAGPYLKAIPPATKIFTCVYDHALWHGRNRPMLEHVVERSVVVFASSKILSDHLSSELGIRPALFEDGVDTAMFSPGKRRRAFGSLVVGWAGNTGIWGAQKGKWLLEEACVGLSGVELRTVDGATNPLSHEQMPAWYRGLDVVCCASEHEGTPNPVLEGAASGLAVVSTRVGIVPEVIGVDGGLIVERSIAAFRDAFTGLLKDRGALVSMGRANRAEVVERWTWEKKVAELREQLDWYVKRQRHAGGAVAWGG